MTQPKGFARVVLAEVDCLADIRVGFGPGLRALPQGQGREAEAALAHERGRPHQDAGAFLGRACAPVAAGIATRGDRGIHVRRGCL